MRNQNGSLMKTGGNSPRWYVRIRVEKTTAGGLQVRLRVRQERVYLGSCATMSKRQALTKRTEVLATINRRQYVLQAQMNFGEFLDHYLKEHTPKLASSTQEKYALHIKNHIRPAFGSLMIADIDTRRIDAFLASKTALAWSTKMDLRNLLCGIFTQAERWGLWRERNPALYATVGRKRMVREHRKLTADETRALLAALPEDLRLMCIVALFCTLRISEVLGLQWKHLEFCGGAHDGTGAKHYTDSVPDVCVRIGGNIGGSDSVSDSQVHNQLLTGVIHVRQRYYRGNIDTVKSERAARDVPMGEYLARELYGRRGSPETFVFGVATKWGGGRISRDDRDILQHFLRPAAKAIGIYRPGFGFHSLRREAVSNLSALLDPYTVMRTAGHAHPSMTGHYALRDAERQAAAVQAMETKLLGKVN